MLSIIVTTFSLLVFVVSMGLCIWLGWRRGLFNSAMRLAFFLLAGVISFFLAKGLASGIGTVLVPALAGMFGQASELSGLSTVAGLLAQLVSGLLAPVLFVLFFFILDKLTWIAYIPLKKKFADREKLHAVPHNNVYGAVLGGVLALGITVACVMPVSGYIGYIGNIAQKTERVSLTEEWFPEETKKTLKNTAVAPIVKADKALSGWLFNALAADLNTPTESAVSVLHLVDSFTETASVSPEEALADVFASPKKTAFITDLLNEVVVTLVPDDNLTVKSLVSCVSDSFNALAVASESLPEAEYQQEVQVLSDLVAIAQEPESVTPSEAVETILKSRFLTESIAEESVSLLNELDGNIIEIPAGEKKKMKAVVKRFNASNNADKNVSALVNALFELS